MRSVLQLQHYQAKQSETLSVSFLKTVLQLKKKRKVDLITSLLERLLIYTKTNTQLVSVKI